LSDQGRRRDNRARTRKGLYGVVKEAPARTSKIGSRPISLPSISTR
jgi:hypothetical protein